MACRPVGAKPLSEAMMEYCQLDPYEQTSMKFQSRCSFADKNLRENVVWKIAAIMYRLQCVNYDDRNDSLYWFLNYLQVTQGPLFRDISIGTPFIDRK